MATKKQPEKTSVPNPKPTPADSAAQCPTNLWNPTAGAAGFILNMIKEGYEFDLGGNEQESTWVFTMERGLANECIVNETVVVSFPEPQSAWKVEHSFERRISGRPLETVRVTLHTPLDSFVRDPEESRDRLERMWVGGAEE